VAFLTVRHPAGTGPRKETVSMSNDPLKPLSDELHALWWHRIRKFLRRDGDRLSRRWLKQSLARGLDHEQRREPLADAFQRAVEASLLLLQCRGLRSADEMQRTVYLALTDVYRFLTDWAAGEVVPTPADLRAHRATYFRAWDTIEAVRFAMSDGLQGGLPLLDGPIERRTKPLSKADIAKAVGINWKKVDTVFGRCDLRPAEGFKQKFTMNPDRVSPNYLSRIENFTPKRRQPKRTTPKSAQVRK
jgi:hypothetical protein